MDFFTDNLFFFFSKVAWAFLSPSNLLIFLFILGTLLAIFSRCSAALKILIPTSILALMITVYPVSDWLMEPLEKRFQAPEVLPEAIDGIIILGGGEDISVAMSWNSKEVGLVGDRFISTKELANIYPQASIIFTGGVGQLAMHSHLQSKLTAQNTPLGSQILQSLGIESERLIVEHLSRNTFENFKNIQPLLPNPTGRYLLVTSAFHMPRSVGIARKFGVDVIAYPVDYRSTHESLRSIDFDFYGHLQALEPAWKEWIGLTAYYWTGKTSEWLPSENERLEKLPDL